jgi:hypothetical protein
MKTYKTWEVIKMLTENPNLIFTSNGDQIAIIENQLMWVASGHLLKLTLDCNMTIDTFNKDWKLIQEPITFMKAAEAFNNGKDLRCEYLDCNDKKTPRTQIYKQSEKPGCMWDTDDLTFYLALTGKWYIEG